MNHKITRRRAAAGLAALGGAALLPRHAAADEAALLEGARKEGTLTWYIAQVDGETAEVMGRAFTAQYPGVKVSVIRTTGQVAYERLTQDLKNNAPQCDVFSTTDIAHMPALMKRNELAQFVPDNAAALAPAFKGLGAGRLVVSDQFDLDADHLQHAEDQAGGRAEELDRSARPEAGRAAWRSGIRRSRGYVGCWTLEMRTLYGWQYFDKLAKNNPRIGRSGNDPITLLNAGECVRVWGRSPPRCCRRRRAIRLRCSIPPMGRCCASGRPPCWPARRIPTPRGCS